ncbi:solute carrier family 41 member 2-like [Sinocyclocheilus grahami]|uniref:solute carrier family 41 member 2-like n=1 Tax=Sinocyclocheilus grahami TaxID=75366 RepID=UPI0007AC7D6E|nr:PREDICTED: solute carrier family 41 member 2-like [Sinocyclocheilus grahami]
MSLRTIGGAVLSSLGPSLAAQVGGAWSSISFRPIPSLLQTMVPAGYTALQEERLAMVDLGTPKPESLKNGFHREPRRHSDRSSRTSISMSDVGDGHYAETEPMLPEGRLSGEEADEEEESEEEGQQQAPRNMPKESPLAMALQILVPFLLAGFGTVSAGVVLDIVQHWEAFKNITEIFILVPALLGLKGNLEMTLASRLSTAVKVTVSSHKKCSTDAKLLHDEILACFGRALSYSHPYVSSLVCAFFMCLTPLWMVISSKHPASRQLLYSGWEPVITAMFISSIGGLILDKTVSDPNLAGIVVYTPVINGIGGNLVAIQSSRISTYLHFHSTPGEVPDEAKGCYYPCRTFCGTGANHRSAQVLLLLVIPGHLIFLYTIDLMERGHTSLTSVFMVVYLAAALFQVFLLLCISDWMVHSMWKSGKDPDSFSIPYLTALGDLLGTALLALSFHFLWIIGDQDSDVGD